MASANKQPLTHDIADQGAVDDRRRVEPPLRRRRRTGWYIAWGLTRKLGTPESPPSDAPIRERCPRTAVLQRDAVYRRLLGGADILAAGVALLLCVSVLGNDSLSPVALLALPLVLLAGQLQGLYDRDELVINKTTLDQAPQLFQLATLYAVLVVVLQEQFIVGSLGAMQVVVLWSALFFLAMTARFASRVISRQITPVERCLFVGTDASFHRLDSKLRGGQRPAEIVTRMRLSELRPGEQSMARLQALIVLHHVHRVIVEPSEASAESTLEFVREAKATGARVSLLPRVLEVVGSSIEIDDIDGLTLLGVRRFGLSRSAAAIKRSFDILGASLGLLAVAPLIAIIAVLIKLDSRGSVIYRQTRVGRDGRPFQIWKFRTMVPNADQLKSNLRSLNEAGGGLFKMADDPRVTRVGRQLRRFSLDELPQLVNVLRGEMSLVGPRPLVSDEDVRIVGLDRRRLHLTPGMTGHWQIMGSARVPLPEMIKLDYRYVAGWSLWSDIKILLRTVPYVVARRGL